MDKIFKINDFRDECQVRGLRPPYELMREMLRKTLAGHDEISIPQSVFDEMEETRRKEQEWEETYNEITTFRLSGMANEDNTEMAISEYAKCIELGEKSEYNLFNAYAHAYIRIIILLHKAGKFKEEAEYISNLLSHEVSEKDRNKYLCRLETLQKKIL